MDTYKKPHWKIIQEAVARDLSVKVLDIISDRRNSDIVKPRHLSMYLMRELTIYSLPKIGRVHGGRDHTSVMYALKTVEDRLIREPDLVIWVDEIKEKLKKKLSAQPDPVFVDTLLVKDIRKRLRYLASMSDERLMEVLL